MLTAMAVGYAILTRPVEGALLVPAVLLTMVSTTHPRRWITCDRFPILVVCISAALSASTTLCINWARFGSPLTTGYGHESWTTPLGEGLLGSLLSPGRGLIWQFPAVVIIPIGLRSLLRSDNRRLVLILLGGSSVLLVNTATWGTWWGGWDWELRLFLPALPLLSVVAAMSFDRWHPDASGAAGRLFVALGFAFQVACILTDFVGGYSATYSGTNGAWRLSALPLIGAWRFLTHVRAMSFDDFQAVDIIWFRLARLSGNSSVVMMMILLFTAAFFARRAILLASDGDWHLAKGDRSNPSIGTVNRARPFA
jgi:hypothetical protein